MALSLTYNSNLICEKGCLALRMLYIEGSSLYEFFSDLCTCSFRDTRFRGDILRFGGFVVVASLKFFSLSIIHPLNFEKFFIGNYSSNIEDKYRINIERSPIQIVQPNAQHTSRSAKRVREDIIIQTLWTKQKVYIHTRLEEEKGKLNKIFDHMHECCIKLCIHIHPKSPILHIARRPKQRKTEKKIK